MVEVKNEVQEETMREVGHLLLEVKCLVRSEALTSAPIICDDKQQIQNDLMSKIVKLVEDVENILL